MAAARNGTWWAADQPSYVSDRSDPNFGECLGYSGAIASTHSLGPVARPSPSHGRLPASKEPLAAVLGPPPHG